MRGSGLAGVARGVRRPLVGAVLATAVALPAVVPAAAQASAPGARKLIAPVTLRRVPPPPPPVHIVYGHKLA